MIREKDLQFVSLQNSYHLLSGVVFELTTDSESPCVVIEREFDSHSVPSTEPQILSSMLEPCVHSC